MWELMSLGLFFSHALIHLAASAKFWKVGYDSAEYQMGLELDALVHKA